MAKDSNVSQPGGGVPRGVGGISGAGGRNVQPEYRELSPSAKESIAKAREAMGVKAATKEELARRLAKERVAEMQRIRNQGRNTR